MFCTVCGEALPQGTVNACPSCGADLRKIDATLMNRQNSSDTGVIFAVFGFIFAAISLFLFPPVFGGLGIWFGTIVRNKGNKSLGLVVIILSTVLMLMGMLLGLYFVDQLGLL